MKPRVVEAELAVVPGYFRHSARGGARQWRCPFCDERSLMRSYFDDVRDADVGQVFCTNEECGHGGFWVRLTGGDE